jgi:hypothetical protein
MIYRQADQIANDLLEDDGEDGKYDHAVKDAKDLLALCQFAYDRVVPTTTD